MDRYFLSLWILTSTLEASLLFRAKRRGFLSRFPLFYSYIGFLFLSSGVTFPIYFFYPQYYASVYWFRFMVVLVAEFAVLVEISDHIFKPYPAISRLGRFIASCLSVAFLCVYIVPSLLQPRPSSELFLDFAKHASLVKAVIVAALLAAARYYRLVLGRNVSGILLGFALYLGVSIANFSAAGEFGRALYANFLSLLFPLSYTSCLLVWNVALWRYESVTAPERKPRESDDEISEPLSFQLGRFNTALTRLLRR